MNSDQLLMISIFGAIAFAIAWVGCALIACLNPRLHKGFGRALFSALTTCAVTFALGSTWHGCESWDVLLCPPIGAVVFGALGATIPAKPAWNAMFIVLRLASPLVALAIGPHLPVTSGACYI